MALSDTWYRADGRLAERIDDAEWIERVLTDAEGQVLSRVYLRVQNSHEPFAAWWR